MVKVAVAEAFGQHLQNVVAVAEAAFDRNTAAYRLLITAMSESGGDLSPEQADELIRVCETLGIAPELMSDDASAIARAKQLNSQIEKVQKRNTARREPLPRMEAELTASTAVRLAVSEERSGCARRRPTWSRSESHFRSCKAVGMNLRSISSTICNASLTTSRIYWAR